MPPSKNGKKTLADPLRFTGNASWNSRDLIQKPPTQQVSLDRAACWGFITTEGEGRNRTRKLYHSEPNTLCFKAYYNLILQGFKAFFDRSLNALSSPCHRPFIARQVKILVKLFTLASILPEHRTTKDYRNSFPLPRYVPIRTPNRDPNWRRF